MAKKMNPKTQTKKLSTAKWDFLQRNKTAKKEYEGHEIIRSFRERYETELKKEADILQSHPEMKAAYDKLGIKPMQDCDEVLKTSMQNPAAVGDYQFIQFIHECPEYFFPDKITDEEINERWLAMLKRNAEFTFLNLTQGEPVKRLLLGVDLTRSKDVIMAEVEDIIDPYQKFYRGKEATKRLKWLSVIDELLTIWDLWESYGQRQCSRLIAKRLELPEQTVKGRWRTAYKLIYGKEYTKEHASIEADKLCVKCKDQERCYPVVNGIMKHEPCAAYLKLAGSNYSRERLFENIEEIMSRKAYDDYCEIDD